MVATRPRPEFGTRPHRSLGALKRSLTVNFRIHAYLFCLIGLAGCSLREPMYSSQPDVIQGALIGGLAEQPRIEVTMHGKKYVGPWRTSLPSREQLNREGSVHQRHMRVMNSEPKSADGEQLECEWILHGTVGKGTCKTAAVEYRLDVR